VPEIDTFKYEERAYRRMTTEIISNPPSCYPDLIEIQRSSFRWFLEEGLIEELNSFSPITDYTGKLELHLGQNFKLKRPKYSVDEGAIARMQCRHVPTRLINKETGK